MSRVRELVRGCPVAVRWIALVATLNALAWGILVPPFHVPDENAHVSYVQYLAESGKLPKGAARAPLYTPQVNSTLQALGFYDVVGRPENRPPGTREEARALADVRAEGAPPRRARRRRQRDEQPAPVLRAAVRGLLAVAVA